MIPLAIGECRRKVLDWRSANLTQENRSHSRVVPVLVAALICDVAVTDPSTGKKNLIGIFDKIWAGDFPTQRPVTLYMKLADAEGHYKMNVRWIQLSSGKVLAGAEGELEATDRLAASDLFIQFPPLPIPDEGRYEFQIWTNDMYLGAVFLDANKRSKT